MKTYEYTVLEEAETRSFTLDDVNHLGKQGWRVIQWKINSSGLESVLFEREL